MDDAGHRDIGNLPLECPLCGGNGGEVLDTRSPGYEWTRCGCGLVYKTGEPDDGRLTATGDLETGAARRPGAERASAGKPYFHRYARRRRRRVAKARRQIRDALEFAPRGRLLDVGCSLGYTMEAARSVGLDASGVDVSSYAIATSRRLGFDAHAGTLTSLPFVDASFAVAMLKHVFEHTPAPRAALAELRRVLVLGGAAFFAVPNAAYFKATRSPSTSRFFRGEAAGAHFVYYTPATLSRLLAEEGFRVVAVHPLLRHRGRGSLHAAAQAMAAPLRIPLRAAASALGLRKEFWLVAVRT